jgi:acetyl/propionyl-CoA carboxylase alpha subunit
LNPPGNERSSAWSSLAGAAGFRLNAAPQTRISLWRGEEACEAVRSRLPFYRRTTFREGQRVIAFEDGAAFEFTTRKPVALGEGGEASDGAVLSPMPGKIVSVSVKAGDTVTRGQTLLVLEAMKMEHALAAPFDGVVAELSAEAGGQVSEGVVLARLEASA